MTSASVFLLRTRVSALFSPTQLKRYPVVSVSTRLANTMSTAEAFKREGVVPDVVAKAPPKLVSVQFNSKVKAELGNTLTPTQVKDQPKVSWEAQEGKLYTLIKTDPDAPSRHEPIYREWHHWLVINIPGSDVDKGETLAEYVGSGPPPKTGLHRYVYLVYQQPAGKISDPDHGHLTNTSAEKRGGFKTSDFAQKHGLGEPEAGNFFLAEYDDYVPELYKQLGN